MKDEFNSNNNRGADQANQFDGTVHTVRIKKRICNNQDAFVHTCPRMHTVRVFRLCFDSQGHCVPLTVVSHWVTP